MDLSDLFPSMTLDQIKAAISPLRDRVNELLQSAGPSLDSRAGLEGLIWTLDRFAEECAASPRPAEHERYGQIARWIGGEMDWTILPDDLSTELIRLENAYRQLSGSHP